MSGWAQDAAERQEEEAEHRRAAIRDPHNAAYHEARADLAEARAEIERLAGLNESLLVEVRRLRLENASLAIARGQRDVMREALRRIARIADPDIRAVAMQGGAWRDADLVAERRRLDCDTFLNDGLGPEEVTPSALPGEGGTADA